jgi:hypothetical protein
MRSWLAVFLLVLMPLQWSWAAMGPTEAHANGPVASVHCSHPHGADSAPGAEVAADHADCGTCHNAGSIALFNETRRTLESAPVLPPPDTAILPASRPADLPERPQWAALATA